MIKLKVIGPNQTEVTINNASLFFSYDTLVAVHDQGIGYFRTEETYSKTTSKHVNAWCSPKAKTVSQTFLNNYLATQPILHTV